VEYNLERKVILNTESKHKSLYEWSLNEVEDKHSRPLIPWNWTLYFTASSLDKNNTFEIRQELEDEKIKKVVRESSLDNSFSSSTDFD
jgi:hypothetical protein